MTFSEPASQPKSKILASWRSLGGARLRYGLLGVLEAVVSFRMFVWGQFEILSAGRASQGAKCGNLDIWRSGDWEIANLLIWRSGDLEIWRSGDLEIWRIGLGFFKTYTPM